MLVQRVHSTFLYRFVQGFRVPLRVPQYLCHVVERRVSTFGTVYCYDLEACPIATPRTLWAILMAMPGIV